MKKGWLLLAGVVLLLGFGSYGACRLIQDNGAAERPVDPGFEMLQRYLQLSPAQVRDLSGIDEEFAESRPVLWEKARAAGEEFEKVVRDPNSDVDEAVQAVERFGQAQNDIHVNTIRYMYRMRQHLTAEQKDRLADLMTRGMREMTRGPRRGGPGCQGRPGGPKCPGRPGGGSGGREGGPWGPGSQGGF